MEIDLVDLQMRSPAGGEQHGSAIARPREPLFAGEVLREYDSMTRAIHHVHPTTIVVGEARRVIEEGHPLAVGRDSKVAQISRRLEQHRAYRILESIASSDHMDDGERGAVR